MLIKLLSLIKLDFMLFINGGKGTSFFPIGKRKVADLFLLRGEKALGIFKLRILILLYLNHWHN